MKNGIKIKRLKNGGKPEFPKLPTIQQFNTIQDRTNIQPVLNPIETDNIAQQAKDSRINTRVQELANYNNQSGMISGMKRKPTYSEIQEQATQSVNYNNKITNNPVKTLAPDIAMALIPEVLMLKGSQQLISKGLQKINPIESFKRLPNIKESFIRNSPIFMKTNNSMTRGIGSGRAGLNDLLESGIVRANPKGRLTNPHQFTKDARRLKREGFKDVEIEEIASNNISEKTFNKLKNYETSGRDTRNSFGEDSHSLSGISLKRKGLIENYPDYKAYKSSSHAGDFYEDAFWYDSGGLPDYFNYPSDYFVRINNVSKYKPYVPDGHMHPTTKIPITLNNPDLDIFKTVKIPIVNKKIGVKIPKLSKGGSVSETNPDDKIYFKAENKKIPSLYRPSIGDNDKDQYVYNPRIREQLLHSIKSNSTIGDVKNVLNNSYDNQNIRRNWKVDRGVDELGKEYISVYDKNILGASYYDRIYPEDVGKAPQRKVNIISRTDNSEILTRSNTPKDIYYSDDLRYLKHDIDTKEDIFTGSIETEFKEGSMYTNVNDSITAFENFLPKKLSKVIMSKVPRANDSFPKTDTSKYKVFGDDHPSFKFLRNGSISNDALKEVIRVSNERGLDPNVLASALAIENGGTINVNNYYNTHDLTNKVAKDFGIPISNNYKDIVKDLGVYPGDNKPINQAIVRQRYNDLIPKIDKFNNYMEGIKSNIDAHGAFIQRYGLDAVNSKQQVLPGVKDTYRNMVLEGANKIRSKNLFNNIPSLSKGGIINNSKNLSNNKNMNIQTKRLNQSIPKLSIGGILTSTGSGALGGAALGPWGIAAGAAVGLTKGLIDHFSGKSAENDQQALMDKQNRQANLNYNANRLAAANPNGHNRPLYMSKGGAIKGDPYKLVKAGKTKWEVGKPRLSEITMQGDSVFLPPINNKLNLNLATFGQDSMNYYKRVPHNKYMTAHGYEDISKLEDGGIVEIPSSSINVNAKNRNHILETRHNNKRNLKTSFQQGSIITDNNDTDYKDLSYIKSNTNTILGKQREFLTDHFYTAGNDSIPAAGEIAIKNPIISANIRVPKFLHKPYANYVEGKIDGFSKGGTVTDNKPKSALQRYNAAPMPTSNKAKTTTKAIEDYNNFKSKVDETKAKWNTPKPIEYVDNGILDNIGRHIALMPNTFNQAVDAIASPFTQMGSSHPFRADYWETIHDKVAKVGTADPHKWNNAYEHLAYDGANAALNRMGTSVISKGVGAIGSKITKMYADKIAKPVIDKATKTQSKTIPYRAGRAIRNTPKTIKNEASYVKESLVGPPTKSKEKSLEWVKFKGNTAEARLVNKPLNSPKSLGVIEGAPPFKVKELDYKPMVGFNTPLTGRFTIPTKPFEYKPMIGFNSPFDPSKAMDAKLANSTGKLIEYHAKSNLNMPFADFMKMYKANPGFMKNVNAKAGLAKGGEVIPAEGGTIVPIAPGVSKVKAHKKGTDTVRTTLEGRPVMVDDKETIVTHPDTGKQVVISHDRTDAIKHEKLLKRMPPDQANRIMANKAIMQQRLDMSKSNRLNEGGGVDGNKILRLDGNGFPMGHWSDRELSNIYGSGIETPPIPNYTPATIPGVTREYPNIESPNKGEGMRSVNTTALPNKPIIQPPQNPYNFDEYINMPRQNFNFDFHTDRQHSNTMFKGYDRGRNPGTIGGYINNPSIGMKQDNTNVPFLANHILPIPSTNRNLNTASVNRVKTNATNPLPASLNPSTFGEKLKSGFGDFKTTIKDPKNFTAVADLALGAMQSISNSAAARKAAKVKLQTPRSYQPILEDVNANASMFQNQVDDINTQYRGINNTILDNSTNVNSALSKLSNIQSDKLSNINRVRSGEIADVSNIRNRNINSLNRSMEQNVNNTNEYNKAMFGHNLQLADMGKNLRDASIATGASIVNNMRLENIDNTALQALANSYNVNWNLSMGIAELKRLMMQRLNTDIAAQQGIS
jgi:hypothetical protein